MMKREKMIPEENRSQRLVVKLIDLFIPPKRFRVDRTAEAKLRRHIVESYDGVLSNEARFGDRGGVWSQTSGWRAAGDYLRLTAVTAVNKRGEVTRTVTTRRIRLPVFLRSRPGIMGPK